jgi:1,4-dihydroxy-6-naphthoate synthase
MKKDSGNSSKRVIKVAHSPDADDRFMFWPIKSKLLEHPELSFEFFEADTQKLNALATSGLPDVCAISAVHYGRVCSHYQPLKMGASVGDNYGPVLVRNKNQNFVGFGELCLSPGKLTTAHAVLEILAEKLHADGLSFSSHLPPIEEVSIAPISKVFEVLSAKNKQGINTSALLIHEGRLLYDRWNCEKLLDIGELWQTYFSSSLPLGINVISRRIPEFLRQEISKFLVVSCSYANSHLNDFLADAARKDSPNYSTLSEKELRHYLELYANETTLTILPSDAKAFEKLIEFGLRRELFGNLESEPKFDWL